MLEWFGLCIGERQLFSAWYICGAVAVPLHVKACRINQEWKENNFKYYFREILKSFS